MTLEQQTLARLVALLDAGGIPYMITGSLASSFHGRPRTTHDADVVIDPTPQALTRLVRALSAAGFYADEGRAQDALARRRQFNVIDPASGFKLDLIVRKERAFSREEFGRRQLAEIELPTAVMMATPEDSILSKLEWARAGGGSEKQLADARGVIEVKGPALDRSYIERWAAELGVLDLWLEMSA